MISFIGDIIIGGLAAILFTLQSEWRR